MCGECLPLFSNISPCSNQCKVQSRDILWPRHHIVPSFLAVPSRTIYSSLYLKKFFWKLDNVGRMVFLYFYIISIETDSQIKEKMYQTFTYLLVAILLLVYDVISCTSRQKRVNIYNGSNKNSR